MYYVYDVQWNPLNEYELDNRQETEVLDVALALAHKRLMGWMQEGDGTMKQWGYRSGRPYVMMFPTCDGEQTDIGVCVFGLRWTDPIHTTARVA